MSHPMSEPWLKWEPIETFPRDGEAYLADDDRVAGGFPQVVFWDDDGRLHVSDEVTEEARKFGNPHIC
jgi:hypothetical protein